MNNDNQDDIIIREGDDEFYGMWADRDIDVYQFVRNLRKGRFEHLFNDPDNPIDFDRLNEYNNDNLAKK